MKREEAEKLIPRKLTRADKYVLVCTYPGLQPIVTAHRSDEGARKARRRWRNWVWERKIERIED